MTTETPAYLQAVQQRRALQLAEDLMRQITLAETGSRLWQSLHAWALHYPFAPTAEDQRQAREWLAAWSRLIPIYGCRCKHEWDRIQRICPPDLSDQSTLYWWTIACHDRINQLLHRPLHMPDWSTRHPLLHLP